MAKIIPKEKPKMAAMTANMNISHKILLNRKAKICLCPRLPKAAVGNIAFRRDATSMRTCVCYVRHQNLINVQADIRYIEISVLFGTFKEIEIWYSTYPGLYRQLCSRVALGSCPRVGLGVGDVSQIRLSIWKIVVENYATRCCCHMGKEQR